MSTYEQLVESDAALEMRISGDANGDGTADGIDATGNGHDVVFSAGIAETPPNDLAGFGFRNLRASMPANETEPDAWTLALWIRKDFASPPPPQNIFSSGNGSATPTRLLRWDNNLGQIVGPGFTTTPEPATGVWVHVVVTVDIDNVARIYRDGQPAGSNDGATESLYNGGHWFINRNNLSGGDQRDGWTYYAPTVWHRALTLAEIATLYAGPQASSRRLRIRQLLGA